MALFICRKFAKLALFEAFSGYDIQAALRPFAPGVNQPAGSIAKIDTGNRVKILDLLPEVAFQSGRVIGGW